MPTNNLARANSASSLTASGKALASSTAIVYPSSVSYVFGETLDHRQEIPDLPVEWRLIPLTYHRIVPPMLSPGIPPFPAMSGPDDLATVSSRDDLARDLVAVVDRAIIDGRLAGDPDATTRSVLRYSLALAIDPGGPSRLRSGHLGCSPRVFPVREIRRAMIEAGIGPSDVYGVETVQAVVSRAIDGATLGDRIAGPGVWPGECRDHRR
jgi:hypothetical protein